MYGKTEETPLDDMMLFSKHCALQLYSSSNIEKARKDRSRRSCGTRKIVQQFELFHQCGLRVPEWQYF